MMMATAMAMKMVTGGQWRRRRRYDGGRGHRDGIAGGVRDDDRNRDSDSNRDDDDNNDNSNGDNGNEQRRQQRQRGQVLSCGGTNNNQHAMCGRGK
jgi:hypothetical protein